jgi:hypothetical protein
MYSAILNPPLFDMTFALLAFLPITGGGDTTPNTDHVTNNQPPHPCIQNQNQNHQIQTLFTTSCALLTRCAGVSQIPLIRTVMRGVLALAWKVGVALPGEAEHTLLKGLGYLRLGCYPRQEQQQRDGDEDSCWSGDGGGCGGAGEGGGEVPVDFDMVVVLPWEVGRRVLGEEGGGDDGDGGRDGDGGDGVVRVDLAGVVAEWAVVKMGIRVGGGGGR